jgi:hypothetical protein
MAALIALERLMMPGQTGKKPQERQGWRRVPAWHAASDRANHMVPPLDSDRRHQTTKHGLNNVHTYREQPPRNIAGKRRGRCLR